MRSCALRAALCMALGAAAAASEAAPAGTDSTSALAVPARAAAPDSLGGYLRALADSTDRYFGASGAPPDTAGLDSVLASQLAQPRSPARRISLALSASPWLSFNRVDGPRWGGALSWGSAGGLGQISGRLGYIAGPNEWRGEGAYAKRWQSRLESAPRWSFDASAGRSTAVLDPDPVVSWLRVTQAVLYGSDRQHYLRRDGLRASLERATPGSRLGIAWRTELESPLVTTATWSLLRDPIDMAFNQPAARGRVREIRADATVRLPGLPLRAQGTWAVARDALGSDFDYDRFRLVLGGDVSLGGIAALVPQIEYGRLTGDSVAQASFYLGGMHSLRSLPASSMGGTAKAFGRLDLIFAPDLLALAHVPHPAALPIQGAAFAGSGAVWGRDPFGGPGRAEGAWPEHGTWRSEIGASLLYRPGIPDPAGFLRLDYARAVGPDDDGRFSLYFSAPLDLIRDLE